MSSLLQDNRQLVLVTPLGDNVLRLESFVGREQISGLSEFDLHMASTVGNIAAADIIGRRVSIGVAKPGTDAEPDYRWFDGYVRQFSYVGGDDRQHYYRAQVVPWLWFLTQTVDCRIFQEKSVLEVVSAIFADHQIADYEWSGISGMHAKWENCVQYRESDFAFISRLLEEEGLFYYFRHEQGRHVLVISDARSAYVDCAEASVSFAHNVSSPDPSDEIVKWEHRYEVRPGRYTFTDYNFLTPSTPLLSGERSRISVGNNARFEVFDYPGRYNTVDEGRNDAKLRMEEFEAGYEVVAARGRCRSFSPGGRFTLARHHNPAEQGRAYVVTAIEHAASIGSAYVTGGETQEFTYENAFTCIPDSVIFRPPRMTPKPFIRGIQTAVVVGDKDDEIHVDGDPEKQNGLGRIRVQFHWDRYGRRAHNASCWMRVVQPIAGSGWGFQFIPRVGQEVVIQFLEGDPDRPVCSGSLYHAEHAPPYGLPNNKTQSGIKTRSTLDGTPSNFNEIRFEDKKGSEQLYIQAEKDMQFLIKNDHTGNTGRNETLSVGNDRSKSIAGNETVSVGGNRTETVGGNESISITGNQSVNIGVNATETVGVTKVISAGTSVVIQAGVSITLQCGASTIHMNQAGFITISGTVINIAAAVNANMAAPITNVAGAILSTNTGAVNLVTGANTLIATGGSVARVTGGQVETIAKGDNVVQGAMVKINT